MISVFSVQVSGSLNLKHHLSEGLAAHSLTVTLNSVERHSGCPFWNNHLWADSEPEDTHTMKAGCLLPGQAPGPTPNSPHPGPGRLPCRHPALHTAGQSGCRVRWAWWWPAAGSTGNRWPWTPRCPRRAWWRCRSAWPARRGPATAAAPPRWGRWNTAGPPSSASPPPGPGGPVPVWPSACPASSSGRPGPWPAPRSAPHPAARCGWGCRRGTALGPWSPPVCPRKVSPGTGWSWTPPCRSSGLWGPSPA